MLLERDGCEGGQGEQWSYLTLTSLSHEHWYRKKCPSKGKGTPFFSTDPTGSILVFRGSLSWCIDLVECFFWYGGRFLKCIGSLSNIDFSDMPTTEIIHCETWMNFSHGSWIMAQQKPIVKSFEQWKNPGGLGCIGDDILPNIWGSNIRIPINQPGFNGK